MRSTRTGAPTPKKEMWLSVIVYHLLAGMLSLCISVRKTAGICEWVCVHMWRPVVDNVCLSAHSSKTQQNNPPENHLTLHQEYRLPSTARSKASQMSVSWRKRKRASGGKKRKRKLLLQFHICTFFKTKSACASAAAFANTLTYSHKNTHTVKCTTHHESQEAQCTMVTFLTWSSPAVSVTLDTHRPWKLVRARINRYCNRLLSHGWFNKAIMTITVCCSCIYNRK